MLIHVNLITEEATLSITKEEDIEEEGEHLII